MSHAEEHEASSSSQEELAGGENRPNESGPGSAQLGPDSTMTFSQWVELVRSEAKVLDAEFYLKLLAWGIGVLLLVLVVSLCKVLAPVFKPLLLAMFLSYLILPLIDWQHERGAPRLVAYVLVSVGFGALTYLVGRIVGANFRSFSERIPEYQENIEALDQAITSFIIGLRLLPRDAEMQYANGLLDAVPTDAYASILSGGTSFFLTFVGASFVVGFFMVFLLMEATRFPDRMRFSLGPQRGGRVVRLVQEINDDVQRYLIIKVAVSATTAAMAGAIMYAFGLDFYATLALLVFLFNFIPYVGSVAATVLPFLVGIAQFDLPSQAFWMAVALSAVQQYMGNYLEPRIQGKGLNLSPLVILASLAFFGWLWGIIGMLVSVPMTSAIRLVMFEFEHTRPLAIMLSDLDDPSEFVDAPESSS